MNIRTVKGLILTLLGSMLISNPVVADDETSSPLDADQHPASPKYESLFPDDIVPLDRRLSWKQRFLGNETFNSEEALPATSPTVKSFSNRSLVEPNQGGFDASGVVKQVRESEGKIKVEHGPIDRLGMPAMTMMFRVQDPAQLAGLEVGAEIDFDVDNTAAGFSIKRLAMKQARFDATGVVRQVNLSEGKIKVEHGPIDRLGMPAMTMLFRVNQPNQLAGVEKGSEIAFNVDNTSAGFSITTLQVLDLIENGFDASGTVKQVRPDQGRLKIEHGPIDKLGMPGMTMLFKVRDPQLLSGLERDMSIEFDVVNEGGGFEITRLRAVKGAAKIASKAPACYRVGPFAKREQALATGKRYEEVGAKTAIESAGERQYVGRLVYVDSHASRDAALATARDLEANGITDYVILDDATKRNALSLGVFGNAQNALQLRAKVEAMNLPVKTEDYYRQQTLHWLRIEQPGSTVPPQMLSTDELESGIRQVPHDCNA